MLTEFLCTPAAAASHAEQRAAGAPARSSLVVCPPTLVGHWAHEVDKFVGPALRAFAYEGPPAARAVLRGTLEKVLEHPGEATAGQLVVMSYETLRADADWVAARPWHYCVLDEGHIIRNPKARVAQARGPCASLGLIVNQPAARFLLL